MYRDLLCLVPLLLHFRLLALLLKSLVSLQLLHFLSAILSRAAFPMSRYLLSALLM